jgi:hypothetical protein
MAADIGVRHTRRTAFFATPSPAARAQNAKQSRARIARSSGIGAELVTEPQPGGDASNNFRRGRVSRRQRSIFLANFLYPQIVKIIC